MRNQIQEAFGRIHNLPPMIKSILAKHDRARSNRADKGFSTKLTFKTYQKLKSEGKVA